MSEDENLKVTGIYSKFWRITLVVFSMLLIFAGGTYVPLLLEHFLKNYFAAIGVGLILFLAGLGLMAFLIRKKLITT